MRSSACCLVLLVTALVAPFEAGAGTDPERSVHDPSRQRSKIAPQQSAPQLSSLALFQPCGQEGDADILMALSHPVSQIAVIDTAVVWGSRNVLRHLYTFDAHGKRTLDRVQKLMGETWVDTMRQTNTYDAHGNMLSDTYEGLSPGCGIRGDVQYLYTYDVNDHLIVSLKQERDSSGWRSVVRHLYSYDPAGNLVTAINEDSSWAIGQWRAMDRDTYSYEANGKKVSCLAEWWHDGAWENINHYVYTYDLSGRDSTELWEQWWGTAWGNLGLEQHAYDSAGDLAFQTHLHWDNDHWQPGYREAYSYDLNHNKVSESIEWWRDSLWVAERHDTLAYDADGRIILWIAKEFSEGRWTTLWQWHWQYDTHGPLTTWMSVDSLGGPREVSMIPVVVDSAKNEYWFYGAYRITLHYNTIVTGIGAVDRKPVVCGLEQNWPNPFNPITIIKYTVAGTRGEGRGAAEAGAGGWELGAGVVTLKVYDLLGREVATLVNERRAPGSYEVRFDASGMASGVYLYRMMAGGIVETRKMVFMK